MLLPPQAGEELRKISHFYMQEYQQQLQQQQAQAAAAYSGDSVLVLDDGRGSNSRKGRW